MRYESEVNKGIKKEREKVNQWELQSLPAGKTIRQHPPLTPNQR